MPVKNSACTKYMSVPREMNLRESFDVFYKNDRFRASTLQICLEKNQNEHARVIGHRNDIVVMSELVRRHVYQLKSVMALFNRSYLEILPRLASKK